MIIGLPQDFWRDHTVNMITGVGPRGELTAVCDAETVKDLGELISENVRGTVPHDGYILSGLDPVTGAECFHTSHRGYRTMAIRRLQRADALDGVMYPFAGSPCDTGRVSVLTVGATEQRQRVRLREIASEGVGSEMRVRLSHNGVVWGGLILLRARGSRPFSPAEAAEADRRAETFGATVRRFVAARALKPPSRTRPVGVVVIGDDDRVKTATRAGREWLELLTPCYAADDERQIRTLWNITYLARHAPQRALSRLPTPYGWFSLIAQTLDDRGAGEVAVTLQPGTAAVLLPAIAAWYGLTPRETAVVSKVLKGFTAKQIARRLDVSTYTINDHFKSVYRKTRVAGRSELLAALLG